MENVDSDCMAALVADVEELTAYRKKRILTRHQIALLPSVLPVDATFIIVENGLAHERSPRAVTC